jgi:hypothetical protein
VNPAEGKLVRIGHTEACRQLAMVPRAGRVPSSFDVKSALEDLGFTVARVVIVQWCRESQLEIVDAASDADITQKLPSQH